MPRPYHLIQALLVIHGLMNILQGFYTLYSPSGYANLTHPLFTGSNDKALISIGLGAIGVGWYELIFALQFNRALILATVPMRLLFAVVVSGWGNMGAVGYEVVVAVVCACVVLV